MGRSDLGILQVENTVDREESEMRTTRLPRAREGSVPALSIPLIENVSQLTTAPCLSSAAPYTQRLGREAITLDLNVNKNEIPEQSPKLAWV
jgi:hypothetical protein